MKKNQNKETLPQIALPDEVREVCGFDDEGALGLHAGPGALVVMKGGMTAPEVADAIETLSKIAADLTVVLAKCAGLCDGCGAPGGRSPAQCVADCELCRGIFDETQRIQIPDYLLEEADIPKDAKLEACVDEESGEITIYEADIQQDITDLPADILSMLTASGVCLAELDERIMLGDIVYGE